MLIAGSHEIVLECIEQGLIGLDFVWVKNQVVASGREVESVIAWGVGAV